MKVLHGPTPRGQSSQKARFRAATLGLVVLGLLLVGGIWVRGRHAAGLGPAGDAAVPDVTRADGVVDAGDLRITLSIAPRPPVAFEKTRVRVLVEWRTGGGARRPALDGGLITFEMTMPMGDHRYALVGSGDGWYDAEVVLPLCASGNPRWYATVEGTVAGRRRVARFRLDLTRPGPAS